MGWVCWTAAAASALMLVVGASADDSTGTNAELFRMQPIETRWVSFENPTGGKGQGGTENQGAKGHAYDSVPAGKSRVLMDVRGCGIIRRIWTTLFDRSPRMLRGMRIDIYWDGSARPAVSAPLGDFFGAAFGTMKAFESDLFSNPEGRSLNCFAPMPFRKGAKVVITNETDTDQRYLFYDIDYTLHGSLDKDALYFHSHWRRERPTTLGRDFEIMPLVGGRGRFLGCSVSMIADPRYGGPGVEGEVKVYLDGDRGHPTLVGTGTEDYIGSAWGAGVFAHRYTGCLVGDSGRLAFYRFHIPDPVFFHKDCRVTIQQMTGAPKSAVATIMQTGAPLKVVGADEGVGRQAIKVLEMDHQATLEELPENFVFFLITADVCATSYFYLDSPENALPDLAPVEERLAGLQ